MTDRELKIIIKADGSVAIGEINKLDKTFEGLGGKTEKTQAKLTKLSQAILGTGQSATKSSQEVEKATTTWNEFATGINQAWESLGKVKRVFESGWDMAKQGAQLQEARSSFEDYSRSVGRNSEEIISKLKKASGGTIGDFQLITTASKAMSLGVTQDADKMANLLEIARNKARLSGMETTDAFNDIVIGIGRASPLILDNLAIRIPAGFEKMTNGMSDADKVAKLLELTLIEGNKQLKEMGGLANTSADDLRVMEVAVSNLKLQVGELTASAFVPFVDDLRQEVIPALSDFLKYIKEVSQELGGFNQDTARMFKQQGLAGEFAEKQTLIDEARRRQTGLSKNFAQTFDGLSSYDQQRFGQNYAGNRNASVEEIRKAMFNASAKIDLEIIQLKKELEATRAKMFAESAFKSTKADIKTEQEALDILDRLSVEIEETDKKAKKTSGSVKALKTNFADLGKFAVKDLKTIGDEFDVFADNMDKLLDEFGDGLDDIEQIRKDMTKALEKEALTNYKNLKNLDSNTAQWGLLNWATSGYLNAGTDGEPLLKFQKKDKQELSQTIAEAVTAGFANADFSDLSMTLGNILSSVISKSIAQSNPVMNAAGGIDFGNLGVNLAVNAATKVLTQPGRFFGGREEHGKEAIDQAASIKDQMGTAYVESFLSEIYSVYTPEYMKEQIRNGRAGYPGTSVGYSWDDSGDGIFSDKTRTYALVDNGASKALKTLTDAMERVEDYNDNVESIYKLKSAEGYEYKVLTEQVDAYKKALDYYQYYGEANLFWSDGTTTEGEDLSEATREVKTALAELARDLGSATAERSTATASGFAKYAPWLSTIRQDRNGSNQSIMEMMDYFGPSPAEPGIVSTSGLSIGQQYDAFESLQTDFMDRNISSYLLDMVKQAGQGIFDLQKLQIEDPEAYAGEYLEYMEKQMSVLEEIMARQEEIFADESKSYEERVAALEAYEQNMEAYHQAKLDTLRLEKAQEEEEARLMAEQRQAKMESALSLVGELSQRSDKIVILHDGDSTSAIKEMMEEFANNPEVVAVLQGVLDKTEAKARFGAD